MLRATAWTVGLFGAGTAISRAFAAGWIEPLVLLALGVALLAVSRRGAERPVAQPAREARPAARHEAGLVPAARAPHPSPALRAGAPGSGAEPLPLRTGAAPVPVPVEQSA